MSERDGDGGGGGRGNGGHMTAAAIPPITEALRAEAKAHPGGWVYAIDPGFDPSANVPPQGIVGAWQSDDNGNLTADFTPNPRYAPTPRARGWAQPTTRLEDVLQLAVAGYAPLLELERAFASAEVVVFSRPEGGLFVAPAEGGGRLVSAFTDAAKASRSGQADYTEMRGSALAAALPEGVRIALDPGVEASAIIDPSRVTAAATGAGQRANAVRAGLG